jgi:signal transduction histidine kinase
VAQEALSNVRKHAHAHHVEVVLAGSVTGGYRVVVRDDGVGFDPESHPDEVPGHLGLVGMRERVEAAGGSIAVHSGPGRGTTVEFGVPAERRSGASLAASRER